MNEFMHVAEIALPLLLQGLGTTAAISVLSILIAMVLGSAVGYMCLSKNKAVELFPCQVKLICGKAVIAA